MYERILYIKAIPTNIKISISMVLPSKPISRINEAPSSFKQGYSHLCMWLHSIGHGPDVGKHENVMFSMSEFRRALYPYLNGDIKSKGNKIFGTSLGFKRNPLNVISTSRTKERIVVATSTVGENDDTNTPALSHTNIRINEMKKNIKNFVNEEWNPIIQKHKTTSIKVNKN